MKSKLAVRLAGVFLMVISLGMGVGAISLGVTAGVAVFLACKAGAIPMALTALQGIFAGAAAYAAGMTGRRWAVYELYKFLIASESEVVDTK